jgi:FAD/FMN-containing dehydrogenase
MTTTIAPAVHAPADADGVRQAILAARDAREPLRLAGAGTWLDGGAPVRAASPLRLDALTGVVAYEPGDLVITARAGTSLAALERVTAEQGQWLALDPPAHADATIGATLATAAWGPLAHAVGTPRDLVLGLHAIAGTGELLRAGGRVVKNVAGFDLVRLFTGSRGTLGAIVECTLRLRARPAHECTLALHVDRLGALPALAASLRAPTLAPLAIEFVSAQAARAVGLPAHDLVLVRLGGNAAFVRAQRDAVSRLAVAEEVPTATWTTLQRFALRAELAYRVSGPVADVAVAAVRERARGWAHGEPFVRASLGRGTVRVLVPAVDDEERVRLPVAAGTRRVHLERAPRHWWAGVDDGFATPLARRVKAAFDPDGLCNPRDEATDGATRG